MNGLRRLALATATAALAGGLAGPTLAADNGTIDARITISGPCITVSPSTLDYGSSVQWGNSSMKAIQYTNCGAARERVFARATDAQGGSATWALTQGSGAVDCYGFAGNGPTFDKYQLVIMDGTVDSTFTPAMLGTADSAVQWLEGGATGEGRQLWINTPCLGSSGANQTMSFQITFTATF